MSRVPQIMVFLTPSGEVCCETASGSGARRKIELVPGLEWQGLRAELVAQAQQAVAQQRLVALATKTEAEGRVEFQRALGRKRSELEAERKQTSGRPAGKLQLGSRSNFSAEEIGL